MDLKTIVWELVTKPFSLCKLVCMFCLKTTFVVINTWMELLRSAMGFHLNLFWKTFTWVVNLISFPVRVLTAVQREKLLEERLRELEFDLETLIWDRRELEDSLQSAIREHRVLESLLAEVEEEHDKAISKIEMLQGELYNLKKENLRIRETKGKTHADKTGSTETYRVTDDGSGMALHDLITKSDVWEEKNKNKNKGGHAKFQTYPKPKPKTTEPIDPYTQTRRTARNIGANEVVVGYRREVAVSQSVFSAILSLIVGIIVWEADDPCMPLVAALFIVVGMSLKSVVEFFSTIDNKPASDAVGLLSLNWFVLGTLTYPTLPRVVRLLSPFAFRSLNKFGPSSAEDCL